MATSPKSKANTMIDESLLTKAFVYQNNQSKQLRQLSHDESKTLLGFGKSIFQLDPVAKKLASRHKYLGGLEIIDSKLDWPMPSKPDWPMSRSA